jgi:exopolysaccharide biosynthesis predicted pyruvyltransferase EpsI
MNGSLIGVLSTLRERDVVVLYNRGNRGDGLIHLGGRRLLADLGVAYRAFREEEDIAGLGGDVLLVYGAGAMSRRTHSLAKLLPKITRRFSEVIVLPASFDLEESRVRHFAESWDKRTTVFCREMVSFSALKAAGVRPRALLLGHDLAFHADLSAWAERPASGSAGLFRRDNEATYSALPPDLDFYDDPSHGTAREPERLLDVVAQYSEIHTDRCHAAIAGAMMGRRVVFYRNNYFKNRAIYDHSLAALTNVRFVERMPFSLRQFMRATYWARMRPVEMKVRRVFQGSAAAASG